jgi:hypothetical protein
MYENGTRPTETVLRMGQKRIKGERWRGMNLTQIYYKYFCKCHNVPLVQL